MAKKKAKKVSNGRLYLEDSTIASMRVTAIQVAAHLPEDRYIGHGMMSGSPMKEPGKTADKVVADAEKLMAFITKPA